MSVVSREPLVVQFVIPGKAVGKGRPQFNRYTGTEHTPQKTRDYEQLVGDAFSWQCRGAYFDKTKALELAVKVIVKPPKSTSQSKLEAMYEGRIKPTKVPDMDNQIKAISDGLNKRAIADDRQFVKINAEKVYGKDDYVVVVIREIGIAG